MKKKYVYSFKEGNKNMKQTLGGKGANLCEMTNIGLPVPQGFVISTEACGDYYANNKKISEEIYNQIFSKLYELEKETGKNFGKNTNPLLVSVRSGAKISMPGMMDTVLNLGLNNEVVRALTAESSNKRFALDSYRRFIQMYSDVVAGIPKTKFDKILNSVKEKESITDDSNLSISNLEEIIELYKKRYKKAVGKDFPQDPKEQLINAVNAVFESWNNPRAILYREENNIDHRLGTAVTVQSMVYGNMGNDCGTGVAFTRDPANGEKILFGEFLMNAQGEDVVAGIRTPIAIEEMKNTNYNLYSNLKDISIKLENHYRDMQDIEFTIEKGKLYILQTRNGKRTAHAAIKIAVDMVSENIITKEEALMSIDPKAISQILHPRFSRKSLKNAKVITKGLNASPGAASGKIYFSAKDALNAAEEGEKVILVRLETSPDDLDGMIKSEGILTARGGRTSHAAVIARGMGKCCVAGASDLVISAKSKMFTVEGRIYKEGDEISLDGSSGFVYEGSVKTVKPKPSEDYLKIMKWADNTRRLKIRTNADTVIDAKTAMSFGAEGIGLTRTEHMFFDEKRISSVRKMILARTKKERKSALREILPYQKEDFKNIFEVMGEKPVTIRLLDPPLHEFLPESTKDIKNLAKSLKMEFETVRYNIRSLHEFNPMLGHRGCRLAVTYPEIAIMQTKAIIEAAIEVKNEKGFNIQPEIMIPLVGEINELRYIENFVRKTADKIIKKSGIKLNYLYGTMIEVPRAALLAEKIATSAQFFSFGTNDLTQMTYGFSRDDASRFIKHYLERDIFEKDPFVSIDTQGVGLLMKMATEKGRSTRKDIKLGICGEHAGDPSTIEFCEKIGLDYVSCSPYRVPVARLAAARAAIINKE